MAEAGPLISDGAVFGNGTTAGGPMRPNLTFGDSDAQAPYLLDTTQPGSPTALSKIDEAALKKIAGELGIGYQHRTDGTEAAFPDVEDRMGQEIEVPQVAVALRLYWVPVIPAFLLLLWTFRSLVIPATAIVLNLLSVGAAYGVLVSVFQGGWGLVHVQGVHHGPITAWLPLFLFVILFGLSMDYHVFILSRIREGHDQGLNTREAIRSGITHSAGVITSAAIVMVAVFSTFATLSVTSMKQLGVGLAVAIFLDATIVRGLLLPAVMTLLGERNWYLPRWMERLISREKPEPQPHGIPVPQAK
jgi:hypothetical protein